VSTFYPLETAMSIWYTRIVILMTKKTKQEKIITELRRKLRGLETPKESLPVGRELEAVKPVSLPTPSSKPVPPTTQTALSYDYSLVAKDLRKTFFFTVLALSLEFVLYFFLK